ncbi:MAG: DNA-binding response regulator, partial [Actinomycetes bacterium]
MHAGDALTRGREAYGRRAWRDAFDALSAADAREPLGADDLERRARAACLIGRDEEAAAGLERAHHAFVDRGEFARAVRCAFWLGLFLVLWGRPAEGGAWMGRAGRLLEAHRLDTVEQGYLLVPAALQAMGSGDPHRAHEMFCVAAATADRFGDADLIALSRLGRGQALVKMGEVRRGTALLDEAMLAVTTGDVSPVAAGIVYCALILACRDVFDWRRAQEWTAVLSRWCATQQALKPYRGQCLVHRSEIMQLRGDWP